MSKGGFGGGAWCVLGDFNAVRRREDRRGTSLSTPLSSLVEMREFDAFIDNPELEDLAPVGGNFTWFHPNGVAMSRLDRVLVSEDWFTSWGDQIVRVLPRDVSDHCPLLLKPCVIESRPKPFRFCNHWLLHKEFYKVVEDWWGVNDITGWMGYVLKEKMCALKPVIREWSRKEFGKVEEKIRGLIQDIKSLDVKGEHGGLSFEEVEGRRKFFNELWKILKSKEVLLFQRSRDWWLKEGDANTKYFHGCVKSRQRRNAIVCLNVGDRLVDSSSEIILEVVNYFKNHFASNCWERPKLDGVPFPMISEDDKKMLEDPFSLFEIEEVVKTSDGNKSPDPDGFNFAFIKTFWNMLKGQVRIMFD
jgi:hypothetical protein